MSFRGFVGLFCIAFAVITNSLYLMYFSALQYSSFRCSRSPFCQGSQGWFLGPFDFHKHNHKDKDNHKDRHSHL